MFQKTITLADGLERKMLVSFGALARIKETTGIDIWESVDSKEIIRQLPAVIHACLLERDKITPGELAELITFEAAAGLVETFFSGVAPDEKPAEGAPPARPLVNGHDSTSSSPTP